MSFYILKQDKQDPCGSPDGWDMVENGKCFIYFAKYIEREIIKSQSRYF